MSDALRTNNQLTGPACLSPSFSFAPWIGLMLPALIVAGCRSVPKVTEVSAKPAVPLHWPTQPAPPLEGENPELWISLAPHLPEFSGGVPSDLLLQAAGGTLLLSAADGQRWQGSAFQVSWSQEPLAQPLTIQRQVLGPFASHESALQQAKAWQNKGAQAVVAHPADWEVWAPVGSPDPGQPSRLLSEIHTDSWRPMLDRQGTPTAIEGPLQIDAPDGLRWGGAVYPGRFRLQRDAYGSWTLLQQVPMESYLLGVVPHEIGAGSPLEALKAQTVLARTWAMANRGRFAVDGYHLCSDTQCQVYSDPFAAGRAVRQAIASTAGQVVTWKDQAVHGVYSASNGGVSSGLDEVWQASAQPYLKPAVDGPAPLPQQFPLPIQGDGSVQKLLQNRDFYGARHPRFRWTRRYSATRLEQLAAAAGSPIGGAEAIEVGGRGPSGRVLQLTVVGTDGRWVLERDQIRRQLRALPSTLFVVDQAGPSLWRFDGGGFGHGAGLSQAGAIDLAGRGWSSERILRHYFPGTELQPVKNLSSQVSP
jgi:SpoIID/LytB domain protein